MKKRKNLWFNKSYRIHPRLGRSIIKFSVNCTFGLSEDYLPFAELCNYEVFSSGDDWFRMMCTTNLLRLIIYPPKGYCSGKRNWCFYLAFGYPPFWNLVFVFVRMDGWLEITYPLLFWTYSSMLTSLISW